MESTTTEYDYLKPYKKTVFDINAAKFHYVVKHNDLIEKAKSDLTVQEMKLVDFFISRIKPTDNTFAEINVTLNDLAKVLNLTRSGKNYLNIANSLRSLRRKEIIIKSDDKMTITGWLATVTISRGGDVSAFISSDLTPYLLELKDKGHYTQYLLNDIVQLNSKYSIALYKLIRLEHGKHGSKSGVDRYQTLVASIEEWRAIFEAPEAYSTSIFMRNCVKRAINEINLKIADLRIDKPGYKKNGHRIVEMRLNVVNGIGEL